MSVAGAFFAAAVLVVVALAVRAELSWRRRQESSKPSTARLEPAVLSPAPPVAPIARHHHLVSVVVQVVVVAVVTAALSLASAMTLIRWDLTGMTEPTRGSLLGGLALAVASTAVAVLFSGSGPVRGPVLGTVVAFTLSAPPAWVVAAVVLYGDDALWLVALVMFMALNSALTLVVWAPLLAARWGRGQVRWFLVALRDRQGASQ